MKFVKKNNPHLKENGHLSDEAAALYVDALVLEEQSKLSEEILSHVQECNECKREIIDVYSFLKDKNYDINNQVLFPEPHKKKDTFNQTNWQYIYRIAAVLLVVLLPSVYFLTLYEEDGIAERDANDAVSDTSRTETPKNLLVGKDTSTVEKEDVQPEKEERPKRQIQTEEPTEQFAGNFETNPNFEYLIDSKFRSTSIEIISPQNEKNFTGEILFKWEMANTETRYLKIINNTGQTLFTYTLQSNEYLFKEKLEPGLYYWKLENDDDLHYMGKFFVDKN